MIRRKKHLDLDIFNTHRIGTYLGAFLNGVVTDCAVITILHEEMREITSALLPLFTREVL